MTVTLGISEAKAVARAHQTAAEAVVVMFVSGGRAHVTRVDEHGVKDLAACGTVDSAWSAWKLLAQAEIGPSTSPEK